MQCNGKPGREISNVVTSTELNVGNMRMQKRTVTQVWGLTEDSLKEMASILGYETQVQIIPEKMRDVNGVRKSFSGIGSKCVK